MTTPLITPAAPKAAAAASPGKMAMPAPTGEAAGKGDGKADGKAEGMMAGGMCGHMMGGGNAMGGPMMGHMMDGMGTMMGASGTKVDVKKTDKGVTITLTAPDAAGAARLQKMAEAMRLMHEAMAQ